MTNITKKEAVKVMKSSATQEEAAKKLGISRRFLFTKRKEWNMPIAAPRGYNA